MFNLKIAGSLIATALLVNFLVNLNLPSPSNDDDDEPEISKESTKKTNKLASDRTPASQKARKKTPSKNEPTPSEGSRENLNQSNFDNVPEEVVENTGNKFVNNVGGFRPATNMASNLPLNRQNLDQPRKSSSSVAKNEPGGGGCIGPNCPPPACSGLNCLPPEPLCPGPKCNPPPPPLCPGPNCPPPPPPPVGPNTCSASVVGGSSNHPVGIDLSCAYTSTIKYCIGVDAGAACCDLETSALTYSTKLIVGPTNGNYCLRFFGDSTYAGKSVNYEQSYIINSELPNLLVGHPKIYYQTTQLAKKSYITSTDFGKAGYGIGQINLKSHDPSPAGEDLTCEAIVNNYVGLPLPAANTILALLDVSLDSSSTQIEIPWRVDQLAYGDNFITSYIENSFYAAPMYSCSTTKVTLTDFEYFQSETTFAKVVADDLSELTAELSPYGYFEPNDTDVNAFRAPAGVHSADNGGQILVSGLFDIFYAN